MFIDELPNPVTASKADWLPGTTWIGFTPTGKGPGATNQCQATIQRQFGNGYVIEYVTEAFGDPNEGFEKDPEYLAQRDSHPGRAGRLIAVHRLRSTYRPLRQILGDREYERLQDMWAKPNNRRRWSVAFPIVESYEIVDRPLASDVFGGDAYRRLYGHSSATLRPLEEGERNAIARLEIIESETLNAWIGIEDEFLAAERSSIDRSVERDVLKDLGRRAPEGMTEERWARVRKRAAWVANKFALQRRESGRWLCDDCEYEPGVIPTLAGLNHRSLLDVHHTKPLQEGRRYSTVADFALLCPNCHRVVHARLRAAAA